MEPPRSEPTPKGVSPAPTAAPSPPLLPPDVREGFRPRHRLDSPHAGGGAPLVQDAEQADLARGPGVDSAAKLLAEVPDRDHARPLTVALAEKGGGARGESLVEGHLGGRDRRVFPDAPVDQILDAIPLAPGQGGEVGIVKAEPGGREMGAGLLDVIAEHLSKRVLQKMGGRVVQADRIAPGGVHPGLDGLARDEASPLDAEAVGDQIGEGLLGVQHLRPPVRPGDPAAVPLLAAGLAVEGRPAEDGLDLLARPGALDADAFLHEGQHLCGRFEPVVAEKLGGTRLLADPAPGGGDGLAPGALPVGAGAGPLLFHGRVEGGLVYLQPIITRCLNSQVPRKAISIMEDEHLLAGDHR